MPTTKRRHPASLIRQLIDQPQRFQFFQAVRVLDLWLRRDAPRHGRSLDRVLRFRNSVALRFPASQIEALSLDADEPLDSDNALQDALEKGQLRHVRLTPAFMGLLGVKGVLPYDYTATIAAQIHDHKHHAGRAFFDAFSHRSMMLFYRAWEQSRIEYRSDGDGGDGLLPLQLALAGKPRSKPAGGAIPDEVAAHYAALLRHRPLPAEAIAGVLKEYFGLPFRLEPFVGAWETLNQDEQSQLGLHRCQLGVNTLLGPDYWRRDLWARLWLGPLARTDFERFLPGASGYRALTAMLALFAMPSMRFEVRLILRHDDIAPARLDGNWRLGCGSFVLEQAPPGDSDTTRYILTF